MLKSTAVVFCLAITALPAAPQTPDRDHRHTSAANAPHGFAGLQRQLPDAAELAHDPPRVVERLFDAYRARDVERLVSLFAEDAVFEDPTFRIRQQGRDGIRKLATDMRAGFSDVTIEIHSMVSNGDMVATEETISGVVTHADGKRHRIRVRGASFFRVRGGRIQQWTDYFDFRTFSEQTRAGS
jgi:steroid delta-isomerase-like uncharacterized protein